MSTIIQYTIDNFWIDHSKGLVHVDYHTEGEKACDKQEFYQVPDLKKYLVESVQEFLKDYLVPDLKGGEREEEKYFWFEALENIKHWIIEDFLNYIIKKNQEELIKVIKILREQYKNSRIGTPYEEEKRIWEKIEIDCASRNIKTDIIQIDEDVFIKMSDEFILINYVIQD